MGDDDDQSAADTVLAAVGSAIVSGGGGALGVALGGELGAGIGPVAVVLAASTVQGLTRAASARMARRRAALTAAVDVSRSSVDELLSRAADDPARYELLVRVFEAADSASVPDKIRALGTVLANGLSGDEWVDESMLLVSALAELEAPHIIILRQLTCPGPNLPGVGEMRWSRASLATARPTYAMVLPAVLGTFERHGLIVWTDGLLGDDQDGQTPVVTSLGERCLILLGASPASGTFPSVRG
jgi:hypothetical protein